MSPEAVVVDAAGQSLSIPAPVEEKGGWERSLVVVDTEQLAGGHTTVWVWPAFDSDADPNERVAGGPQLLSPAERDRLSRSATAAR